eukprot:TRINITY_DN83335_c0_g1_i1.p1 TRINITY_DN83335_c0_g1~~TRINITY_DN83335_c0_g1_i1.p1  ORF type:complete len:183 (-),score=24.52 TRINITY_DN83335_c0_g1_i1:109-657(-)
MSQRANGTFALPPERYSTPKGRFWQGTGELERFPPKYGDANEVFEEYLNNPSMAPSRHVAALKNSAGLMELHYNTMRKRAQERAQLCSTAKKVPTMDRAYTACTGYSGFIPGKLANNICGCTHANGSKIAMDIRGRHFPPPMSGFTISFSANPKRCSSAPQLNSTLSNTPSVRSSRSSVVSR